MRFFIVKGQKRPSDILDFLDVRLPEPGDEVSADAIRVEISWGLIAYDLELSLFRKDRPRFRELLAHIFEEGARWARDQEVKICRTCGDRFFPALNQGTCQRDKCREVATLQGPWR